MVHSEDRKPYRKNIYFSEADEKMYQELREYMLEDFPKLNISDVFRKMVITLYDLFIVSNPDVPYQVWLNQLKQLSLEKSSGEVIQKDLKVIKNQLDLITYLSLANYHIGIEGPMWEARSLKSIHSDLDENQKELILKISEVIKADRERGQVVKHSR